MKATGEIATKITTPAFLKLNNIKKNKIPITAVNKPSSNGKIKTYPRFNFQTAAPVRTTTSAESVPEPANSTPDSRLLLSDFGILMPFAKESNKFFRPTPNILEISTSNWHKINEIFIKRNRCL